MIRRSYLLDALDFIFGDDEGQREFAVCYDQGVFELFRWDDHVPMEVLLRRRCYIAGYLAQQWLLPVNEWVTASDTPPPAIFHPTRDVPGPW